MFGPQREEMTQEDVSSSKMPRLLEGPCPPRLISRARKLDLIPGVQFPGAGQFSLILADW